jgi:branched-chain amino acid transport system permease protein
VTDLGFFLDLFVNGLMIGSMYALVALGFVLIYKATSVINFAQGELVMFAGYIAAAMVSLYQLPLVIAVPVLLGTMLLLGFALERGVLRPLVGRNVISVVMVTVGLAQVFQGLAAMVWGAATINIPLPIRLDPYVVGPVFLSPINIVAAVASVGFLVAFAYFFRRSRLGIAMRAVANDQQAAMAVGINVRLIFALSWAIAGLAAAIGGIVWGNMLGVDTHLALVGLKVFPAVILGGLDSVPGAVLGGLIIGAVESVAAGYVDPYVGGGTKDFLPYVLMILALMIRPYGFFGREIIERV